MTEAKAITLRLGLVSKETEPDDAWKALSAWTAEQAGVTLERVAVRSYGELTSKVRSGECELAWLGPVLYAWLAEAINPIGCFVRGGETTYGSALLVAEGSAIEKVEDLRGKRPGWIDRWSASGYVVPRIELAKKGLDPTRLFHGESFHVTPAEALRALTRGDCDVVATFARKSGDTITGAWSDSDDAKVRVLAFFGPIPPDMIATRRNLAPSDFERAAEALRKASADPAGRERLEKVFGGHELREGATPGHEELRRAYEKALADGLFD